MNHSKIFLLLSTVLLLTGCGHFTQTSLQEQDSVRDPEEDVVASGVLDPNQTTYSLADRASWYEKLNWPKSCEEDFSFSNTGDLTDPAGIAFYNTDSDEYLLRVDCSLGAYQKSMVFMLVNINGKNISGGQLEQQVYNPETKTVEISDAEDGQFIGFDSFDSKTKLLTIYTKDRGVGDCGSHSTYRLKNTDLELIKEAYLSCEDADAFHLKNPNTETMPEWPVIFEKK